MISWKLLRGQRHGGRVRLSSSQKIKKNNYEVFIMKRLILKGLFLQTAFSGGRLFNSIAQHSTSPSHGSDNIFR